MSKKIAETKGRPIRKLLCKLGIHTKWELEYTSFSEAIRIPYVRVCRYCGHKEDNPFIQTR